MNPGVFLTFALSVYISVAFSSPSGSRPSTAGIDSITLLSNLSTPSLYPAYPVSCLIAPNVPNFILSDCSDVINEVLLGQPDVFKERIFHKSTYRNERRGNSKSRWVYKSCEVYVEGGPNCAKQATLSFFDIALGANKILAECAEGATDPIQGSSLIGYPNDDYYVILTADENAMSAPPSPNSLPASDQPAVMSVSEKKAPRSLDHSDDAGRSRDPETKDSQTGISHIPNRSISISNSTLIPPPDPAEYPVHCFSPTLIVLPPAEATDCTFLINHVILRLFNPMALLTFGFTDDAQINLTKPWYRKWQRGQCMISVMNNDATQRDSFRMFDVGRTARRVSAQCVVATERKMGGVSHVGTDGRGFYVYVGGPLPSGIPWGDDGMLLNESSGIENLEESNVR